MKLAILLTCGAVATCACSSNKPAEDATQVSFTEQPSMPPPVEQTDEESRPSNQNGTAAPSPRPMTDTPSTTPPPAEPPPGPAPASNDPAASNAPGTPGTPPPQGEPDNTRVNKRDRGTNAATPMDQGNGGSDLKITQQIRQAVMADGSLSFTAKNVKIITVNGKVTLRGPVNNTQERMAIEASARRVAGDTNVDNQIEVKK